MRCPIDRGQRIGVSHHAIVVELRCVQLERLVLLAEDLHPVAHTVAEGSREQ